MSSSHRLFFAFWLSCLRIQSGMIRARISSWTDTLLLRKTAQFNVRLRVERLHKLGFDRKHSAAGGWHSRLYVDLTVRRPALESTLKIGHPFCYVGLWREVCGPSPRFLAFSFSGSLSPSIFWNNENKVILPRDSAATVSSLRNSFLIEGPN